MSQEIIIGVSITLVVAIIIGIKGWLFKLVNFKMDESAIARFLKESVSENEFHSTEAISAATEIGASRVAEVCSKSNQIKGNAKEKDLWCLI